MLRRTLVAALLAAGPFAAGTVGAQPAEKPNPSFNVVNRATQAINELYASAGGQSNWGRDRLGERTVAPGATFAVRLPADGNCVYDVRVVYADGVSEERRNLNTCNLDNVIFPNAGGRNDGGGRRAPGAGRAAADTPAFRLVNRGRSEVNNFYASLPSEDDWGEDRLGDATVAAGQSKMIRLPVGECVYDVRIVYANGEATEKRRVNLCTITDMRVP